MARVSVSINSDLCDNSQNCVAVCPMEVFELKRGAVVVARVTDCSTCLQCIEACPEGAVEVDY